MQSKLRFVAAALIAGAAFCSLARADEFDARYQAIADARGKEPEPQRLQALFKLDWDYGMSVSPEAATYYGVPGGEDRWTDLTPAAIARRKQQAGRALPVLATIDREKLGPVDKVSYDIFKRLTDEEIEGAQFPRELLQVNQMGGVQQDAAQTLDAMRADNAEQLGNQVARLKALPAHVDQVIALLQDGLAKGITPPQITLRDVPAQVLAQIPDEPMKSPLLKSFVDLPAGVSGEQGLELRAQATKVYTAEVKPAFQRLNKFLTEKYIPAARQDIAASSLPNGVWAQPTMQAVMAISLAVPLAELWSLSLVKR